MEQSCSITIYSFHLWIWEIFLLSNILFLSVVISSYWCLSLSQILLVAPYLFDVWTLSEFCTCYGKRLCCSWCTQGLFPALYSVEWNHTQRCESNLALSKAKAISGVSALDQDIILLSLFFSLWVSYLNIELENIVDGYLVVYSFAILVSGLCVFFRRS